MFQVVHHLMQPSDDETVLLCLLRIPLEALLGHRHSTLYILDDGITHGGLAIRMC